MSLSAKDVAEIMRLLDESRFDRLSLEMDGVKLELERGATTARKAPAPRAEPAKESSKPAPKPAASKDREPGLLEVVAPLLGTYYRAPKPGEPPFVEVGDTVEDDTVIGIVEVMKLMNSVRSGVAGEIVEILATNGELVEHGEVLMLVRPKA
jgi:acetyl-CoA carboxylase biotin carboxyl carrier protein